MRPAELYLPYVCETFRAERQGRREAWGNEEGTTRCATCGHVGLRVVAPAAVADSSVARFKTDGYALADFGNCPDVPEPPAGTVCTDAFIEVFREAVAVGGGSVAGPKTPWSAFLSEATLTFGPDGDFVASDERTGFLPVIDPADVTYDQQHLAFASLKAEIP